jgi:hypothetical protein
MFSSYALRRSRLIIMRKPLILIGLQKWRAVSATAIISCFFFGDFYPGLV